MVMTTRTLRAKANDLTKCMNMLILHNVVAVHNSGIVVEFDPKKITFKKAPLQGKKAHF